MSPWLVFSQIYGYETIKMDKSYVDEHIIGTWQLEYIEDVYTGYKDSLNVIQIITASKEPFIMRKTYLARFQNGAVYTYDEHVIYSEVIFRDDLVLFKSDDIGTYSYEQLVSLDEDRFIILDEEFKRVYRKIN